MIARTRVALLAEVPEYAIAVHSTFPPNNLAGQFSQKARDCQLSVNRVPGGCLGHSSANTQRLTCDEAGSIGGYEDYGIDEVLWAPPATHRI